MRTLSIVACTSFFFISTLTSVAQTEITKERSSSVIASYLSVKDALVASDAKAAGKAAVEIVTLLNNQRVEGKVVENIKSNAEKISKSAKLDDQRVHFETLTKNVYDLVKAESANSQELYYQYCPMAFNNKGAYWLSSEKAIRNPYFGDKMLKCGMVKETIK